MFDSDLMRNIGAAFAKWNEINFERLFVFDHALSIFSVSACVVTALIFVFASKIPARRSFKRLRLHLGANRFHKELALDLKFFSMRWIYFPLKIFIFAATGVTVTDEAVARQIAGSFLPHLPWSRIELEPWLGTVLLTLYSVLVTDFSSYISHRAMHKYAWLWEFHKTHHSARHLNPLTRYRIHPVDQTIDDLNIAFISGFFLTLWSLVFRIPSPVPIFYGFALFQMTFFVSLHLNHSHCRVSWGNYLNRIFYSPIMHQAHHGRAARLHDRNYGVIFAIWDWMFGTLYLPKPRESFAFGVEDEYDVDKLSFTKELIKPFRAIFGSIRLPPSSTSSSKRSREAQAGYTLIEITMGAALTSILMVIALTVLLGHVRGDLQLTRKVETSNSLERALLTLKNLALLGLDIRSAGNVDLQAVTNPDGEGYVRNGFIYEKFSDLATPTTPLMFFARENRPFRVVAPGMPWFSATAVFFQAPTKTTPGAIYIDAGSSTGTEALEPDDGDLKIENVVGVALRNQRRIRGTPRLERIDLSITLRYFQVTGGDQSKAIGWCPPKDLAQCPDLGQYRDVTRTVVLEFANNSRLGQVQHSSFEFPFGFYIFKSQMPQRVE